MFFNNSSNRGLSGAQISKLKLILYYEHLRAKEMAQAVKYSSYNHEAPIGSPGPMEKHPSLACAYNPRAVESETGRSL